MRDVLTELRNSVVEPVEARLSLAADALPMLHDRITISTDAIVACINGSL